MKNDRIMTYEAFVANNGEGDLITPEHIQKAISDGMKIKVRNVEGLKDHKEDEELEPIDVDEEGSAEKPKVTVRDNDGNIGYVDLDDVIEVLSKKAA
jgi:hypothetical protein